MTLETTMAGTSPPRAWAIAGSYFEACNCQAVCPCRAEGGRKGGESTYGQCDFVLSWLVRHGYADELDLGELATVLIGSYVDGKAQPAPYGHRRWQVSLYVDERGTAAQQAALAAILLGRAGGDTLTQFAAAIGHVHAVSPAAIALNHHDKRPTIEVTGVARVAGDRPASQNGVVSCAIPGHHHPGQEWVTSEQVVTAPPLTWTVTGRCGFATTFAYSAAQV